MEQISTLEQNDKIFMGRRAGIFVSDLMRAATGINVNIYFIATSLNFTLLLVVHQLGKCRPLGYAKILPQPLAVSLMDDDQIELQHPETLLRLKNTHTTGSGHLRDSQRGITRTVQNDSLLFYTLDVQATNLPESEYNGPRR